MTDRDRILAALCDTFLPGEGDLPSASGLGVDRVLRSEVAALGRPALVAELDQLLDTIESPLLNLALTGRAVRFTSLGQADREEYLKRWAASPLTLKRRAFQVTKRLVLLYAYGKDGSPYAARSGYARPPLRGSASSCSSAPPFAPKTTSTGASSPHTRHSSSIAASPRRATARSRSSPAPLSAAGRS